jgi:Protein of unknown function (DUF1353)
VRLLDNGSDIELIDRMVFIDINCEPWVVPAGAIVNGASIPRFLWRVIGSPLTGKYRNASILHDYYCVIRNRPSPQVHAMFYDKMREDGVAPMKAFAMWLAVRLFGPRF